MTDGRKGVDLRIDNRSYTAQFDDVSTEDLRRMLAEGDAPPPA